jgi:group I intron endonuclease
MIIYCIENLINGKKYIGQSSFYNSNEEFQKSNYWGGGIYIRNAIKKYGLENFKKYVLIKDIFKIEELNKYEILWIKKLNTKQPVGYNLSDGGESGSKGYIWNEEQKQKHKIIMNEIRLSGEIGKKIRQSLIGHIVSQKTRKLIGKGNKDKVHSEKQNEQNSKLHKGKKRSKQTCINIGLRHTGLKYKTSGKIQKSLKKYYETHDGPNKGKRGEMAPHAN